MKQPLHQRLVRILLPCKRRSPCRPARQAARETTKPASSLEMRAERPASGSRQRGACAACARLGRRRMAVAASAPCRAISRSASSRSPSRCSPRPIVRAQNARSAGVGRGHGADHRERHLALAEVVADVLAERGGDAAVVEQVVGDLEGDPERVAIGRQSAATCGSGAPAITPPTSVAAANSAAVLPRTT